jgi:putative DNA-invertase from lambdoid prophage Rac
VSHIAYYRVSSKDQSIAAQKSALTHGDLIEREFVDEAVSGAVVAANRPGFAELLNYIRSGDTLHVYAVDRLGRDAIDVQTTIRALLQKGVTIEINGLGQISNNGVGELIIAVLAQVADMERQRIVQRTKAGRDLAKVTHAATGKTHKGKATLGRPAKADAAAVKAWRGTGPDMKSIAATAKQFELSESTVKRYCAA